MCEDHFDPKYLRRQFNRTILHKTAIPFVYNSICESSEVGEFLITFTNHRYALTLIDIKISEFIEMAESEEDEDKSEQTTESTESTNDQNKVIILLNKSPNARIQQSQVKIQDTQTSKIVQVKDLKRNRKVIDDDKEMEVDLIVLGNDDESQKANEDESEPGKKLRVEIESTTNQAKESSPKKLTKISTEEVFIIQSQPQIAADSLRPRKSIDGIVSSSEAFDTNNEDRYFALSLLGTLKRLTPHKRAIAKCHILSYLTELEYGSSSLT